MYRCKQKGTQKPYALKVLKKTVSLFQFIIGICDLEKPGALIQRTKGQRVAMCNSIMSVQPNGLLSDGNCVTLKVTGSQISCGCGEKSGKENV